jgi:hypothetical protein
VCYVSMWVHPRLFALIRVCVCVCVCVCVMLLHLSPCLSMRRIIISLRSFVSTFPFSMTTYRTLCTAYRTPLVHCFSLLFIVDCRSREAWQRQGMRPLPGPSYGHHEGGHCVQPRDCGMFSLLITPGDECILFFWVFFQVPVFY